MCRGRASVSPYAVEPTLLTRRDSRNQEDFVRIQFATDSFREAPHRLLRLSILNIKCVVFNIPLRVGIPENLLTLRP